MAHLLEIPNPKCRCGAKATVTLYNRYNARCGDYCARCGKAEVKRLTAEEWTK